MTTKINLTELLADREAGTGGDWEIGKCPCDHRSCSYYGTSNGSFDQGNGYTLEDARRIARLPALEAAYIEAVGLLAEVLPDLKVVPHSSEIEADIRKFLGDEK